MSDNVTLNPGAGGAVVASDDVGGVQYQIVKLALGGDGVAAPVEAALPVSGPLTDAQLRAAAVPVSVANVAPIAVLDQFSMESASLLSSVAQNTADLLTLSAGLPSLTVTANPEDSPHTSGSLGSFVLAVRNDANASMVSASGDYSPLQTDEVGRLKVSSQPSSYPDITGDITAVQATINTPVAGGTVTGDVSRASNVMAFCTGTFAGVNVTFEASIEATGDNNWFGIQAVRTNANIIETATGVLGAAPAYAWELSVNALARLRVRATARTSGTQSWRFRQGTYATEPIPAAQVSGTQPVSGTVTATVGTSITGGTISPLTVAGASAEASSAKTTSGNSSAGLTNASGRNAHFIVNVTAVAGTTPTLAVRVQIQDPVSSNWVDLPGAVSASITATGATLFSVSNLPRTYRLAWVITGTTPSFTFSVGFQPVI